MGMSPNTPNAYYPPVVGDGKTTAESSSSSIMNGKADDHAVAHVPDVASKEKERQHGGEALRLQSSTVTLPSNTTTAIQTIEDLSEVRKDAHPPSSMVNNTRQGTPPTTSLTNALTTQSFLLATPTDRLVLNEMHCLIRQNVEVFVATEIDASQPQPGRKLPVEVGQIGIRCIHCKDMQLRRRAKRAVCYPSTISGIFHSVSNMKFDHFKSCPGMDEGLKEEFRRLRSNCARKNPRGSGFSSTANYYMQSAKSQGLSDHADGIRLSRGKSPGLLALAAVAAETTTVPPAAVQIQQPPMRFHSNNDNGANNSSLGGGGGVVSASMMLNARANNHAATQQRSIQMHQPMLSSNHSHNLQRQHQRQLARHQPQLLIPSGIANGAAGGLKKPLPTVNHVDYSQPAMTNSAVTAPSNIAVEGNKVTKKNPPAVMHVNWDKFDGATGISGNKRPYDGALPSMQSKQSKKS
eukprot:CAMPEP_0116018168 /NCGR_PEP_ID=MMETSP0321-20121206/8483_1 /TAXON_ID=163516 /ORGANISM="Leptocylindrus danicus var. danicus, Strain B650" /LENGTH=463 /DNA_ID=CAMNT_0003488501 /DNA_START=1007 /DNA_END=2398 /DNA_ORIENTATION=+